MTCRLWLGVIERISTEKSLLGQVMSSSGAILCDGSKFKSLFKKVLATSGSPVVN